MSLKDAAIMVRSNFAFWSPYKKEDDANELIEQAYQTKGNVGNFNKHLLKHSVLRKRMQGVVQTAYAFHIAQTSPWYDKGYRIINALCVDDYVSGIKVHRSSLAALIEAGKDQYERDVMEDKTQLGKLANESDYPSYVDFCKRFFINTVFMPFPNTEDFRVDVPEFEKAKLQDMLQNVNGLVRRDIRNKVLDALDPVISHYGDPGCKVYESHRDKIAAVVDLIPTLNVNQDADIKSFWLDLSQFVSKFEPYTLRMRPEDKFHFRDLAVALAAKITDIIPSA